MKYFYHATMLTGLVTALAFPVYAASDSMDATMMTCANFTAMDADGQMKAMEAMKMATDEMASDEMASDEMASDEMASDEMASDEMASDEMASDEMMAIASACENNPDMMAMDAMMAN